MKLPPTPANLRFAERLRAKVLAEITLGTFDYAKSFPESRLAQTLGHVPGNSITVADALQSWLSTKAGEVRDLTLADYREYIKNHLIPAFGSLRLTELTREAVKEWVSNKAFSTKRLNNLLTPLRGAMAAAYEGGQIERDPLANWRPKRREAPTKEDDIEPFTPTEVEAICNASPILAPMWTFWVWTGLRTSELIALEWTDVNWQQETVSVWRAKRDGKFEQPKTNSSRRLVKLLAPALAALKAQRAVSELNGGAIWLNPRTGEPWHSDGQLRKTGWAPAIKRSKVGYRYPYQCRHTFASWMLSAGENPIWVARQMGHTDWTMIARTYGRFVPDVYPHAGERATAAIAACQRSQEITTKA